MERMEFTERRRAERIALALKVELIPSTHPNDIIEAVTKDISGLGMRITTDRPIRERQSLLSRIYFPGEKNAVIAPCRVVWVKETLVDGKPYFDAGFEYVHMVARAKERFAVLFCTTAINAMNSRPTGAPAN